MGTWGMTVSQNRTRTALSPLFIDLHERMGMGAWENGNVGNDGGIGRLSHLSSSTSMTHCSGVLSLAATSSVRWNMSMLGGMGTSLLPSASSSVDFPKHTHTDTHHTG